MNRNIIASKESDAPLPGTRCILLARTSIRRQFGGGEGQFVPLREYARRRHLTVIAEIAPGSKS